MIKIQVRLMEGVSTDKRSEMFATHARVRSAGAPHARPDRGKKRRGEIGSAGSHSKSRHDEFRKATPSSLSSTIYTSDILAVL